MANVDSFKLFANLYHNMQANIVTYQRNESTGTLVKIPCQRNKLWKWKRLIKKVHESRSNISLNSSMKAQEDMLYQFAVGQFA